VHGRQPQLARYAWLTAQSEIYIYIYIIYRPPLIIASLFLDLLLQFRRRAEWVGSLAAFYAYVQAGYSRPGQELFLSSTSDSSPVLYRNIISSACNDLV
jgi:hypothetical protein